MKELLVHPGRLEQNNFPKDLLITQKATLLGLVLKSNATLSTRYIEKLPYFFSEDEVIKVPKGANGVLK